MLVIREDQLEALGAAMALRQKKRIRARLAAEFVDPPYPEEVFEFLFTRAEELGYEEEGHVHRFCRLAPYLGQAPREHPLLRWIAQQAANDRMTPEARLSFLEDQVMPRLIAERWRKAFEG